jgi:hypothetical protein
MHAQVPPADAAAAPVSGSLTAADAAAVAADPPQPVAVDPPPLDTSGITVGDVFFAWPSRDALASFALMAALIALIGAVVCYLGAPPLALGTAGAVVSSPAHTATVLSQALCRVGAGTNQLGVVVLAASSEAPVQFLAGRLRRGFSDSALHRQRGMASAAIRMPATAGARVRRGTASSSCASRLAPCRA